MTPRRLVTVAPEPWGTRFHKRRTALGLTQVQVSGTTGLTQQSISRIERNEVVPRFRTLELLAQSVGTSVDELFPMEARPRAAAS